jgi:hypothetical protein
VGVVDCTRLPLQYFLACTLVQELEIVLVHGNNEYNEQQEGYKTDEQTVSFAADIPYFISHGLSVLLERFLFPAAKMIKITLTAKIVPSPLDQ